MDVPKYPSTPYWHLSPSVVVNDKTHESPSVFVGREIVITEKIDGSNTLIHDGQVYARSVSQPSSNKWQGMTRAYHSYKTIGMKDIFIYGEDIYGVHSIVYDPVPADRTLYLFDVRTSTSFLSFDELVECSEMLDIPTVPVLFQGKFNSKTDLAAFIQTSHNSPSMLGGASEGIVMRVAGSFAAEDFAKYVCKSVRPNHVQTTRHWTRHWEPCQILPPTSAIAAIDAANPLIPPSTPHLRETYLRGHPVPEQGFFDQPTMCRWTSCTITANNQFNPKNSVCALRQSRQSLLCFVCCSCFDRFTL